jgi:hypothetical protein
MEVSHGDSRRTIPNTRTYEPRASERGIYEHSAEVSGRTGTASQVLSSIRRWRHGRWCVLVAITSGVYLWRSREDAESLYTEEWKNFVKEKYGAEPTIVYFQTPVVVDNLTREIIRD